MAASASYFDEPSSAEEVIVAVEEDSGTCVAAGLGAAFGRFLAAAANDQRSMEEMDDAVAALLHELGDQRADLSSVIEILKKLSPTGGFKPRKPTPAHADVRKACL